MGGEWKARGGERRGERAPRTYLISYIKTLKRSPLLCPEATQKLPSPALHSLEGADELLPVRRRELGALHAAHPWVDVEAGELDEAGHPVGADAAVDAGAVLDKLAHAVAAGAGDALEQVNVSQDTLKGGGGEGAG